MFKLLPVNVTLNYFNKVNLTYKKAIKPVAKIVS